MADRDKETLSRLVREQTKELLDAHMKLESAKRLSDLGVLATTVAHELRNPLAAISMAASNIRRKVHGLGIEKHIETIEKKVAESDQIINNLLYYSRIRPPHFENVKIVLVLEECIENSRKQAKKRFEIERDLDGARDVTITADPLQAQEVFYNILSNAYDAVDDGTGRIEVKASRDAENVRVSVSDNGCGISKENIARIFDPFFTTKARGTGLGLSVCQQIIRMHGGDIGVDSEPGAGTVVAMTFPTGGRQ